MTPARFLMGTIFLVIFMGMWVIVNWWVWPVPDFHFRKLEAMLEDAVFGVITFVGGADT